MHRMLELSASALSKELLFSSYLVARGQKYALRPSTLSRSPLWFTEQAYFRE